MQERRELIEYFRDPRGKKNPSMRHRQGVFVAYKDGDTVNIGWSICNDKDEFDRELGLRIARGRADAESSVALPQKAEEHFHNFTQRAMRYFKCDRHSFVHTWNGYEFYVTRD